MSKWLSLRGCSIILSFNSLTVSPQYVSEHLTKYVRPCLCSSFVWSFMVKWRTLFLLLYKCFDAWFFGNNLLTKLLTDSITFCPCSVLHGRINLWVLLMLVLLVVTLSSWFAFLESLHFISSRLEVFLRKGVLKICSKFTGEHPCWFVISIKLLRLLLKCRLPRNYDNNVAKQLYWNRTSAWVFSSKFFAHFQNTFS